MKSNFKNPKQQERQTPGNVCRKVKYDAINAQNLSVKENFFLLILLFSCGELTLAGCQISTQQLLLSLFNRTEVSKKK